MSNLLVKPLMEQDSSTAFQTVSPRKQTTGFLQKAPLRLVEEGTNSSTKSNKRVTIPSPNLTTKDTVIVWSNFVKTSVLLKRSKKHMIGWFALSLNVKPESTEEGLEMPISCTKVKIRHFLDKYIHYFVICKKCKAFETDLIEKEDGLYVKCGICAFEVERNPKK